MKQKFSSFAVLVALIGAVVLSGCHNSDKPYKIKDNQIIFNEPERVAGQQSMLGFAAEPMDVVRIGFIGLGMRGPGAVKRFTQIEGAEIVALCDLLPENIENTQCLLESLGRPRIATEAVYSGEDGWKELCQRNDIDLIYIVTPWRLHTPMAVYAMECGKHVAVEVPAAMSIAECWQLVDTSERTRRHCMMLENCIYDHFELTTLNMAQQGLFGEILHVEGAYIHNLDEFWDEYQGCWRLKYNQQHRGDLYATHGLGPVCQLLNIHRGDRMTRLVSMDTKSVCGLAAAKEKLGADTFANGDHTCTLIATEAGKTISLQHNVYTPRPYNRLYQLSGTKGFANKYPVKGFLFADTATVSGNPDHENLSAHKFVPDAVRDALLEKYRHPIQIELMEQAKRVGGHGGMDYIMDARLVYCLRHGLPLDQDVYDAAEWSCIGELSAASIENGSMPVLVPDFTRGEWNRIDGYRHAIKE